MRIAIVSQTYYPGNNGQSVFTIQLAEGLAQAGHQVMVITPANRPDPHSAVINNVHLHQVKAIPLPWLYPGVFYTPLPGGEISRLFNTFKPDVVHLQDHYPLCHSALQVARARGLPVVGTNHFLPDNLIRNSGLLNWNRPFFNRLLWQWMLFVFNGLDAVTTPTRTAAQILSEQSVRPPINPVSCGVDTQRFQPHPHLNRGAVRQRYGLDPDRTLLLYVGRVDREKNLDVLLRALRQTNRDDLQLAIVGRPSNHLPALQALARELKLGGRVVFTGYVPADDLPALYNSADVFAMPSTAELQSIATLEAMACGKPLLAADACALPELVTNGANGYLFCAGDAADAAGRILQLMAERNRWPAMSITSLERARQHSLSQTIQRYESIYGSVASINRAARVQQSRTFSLYRD